MQHNGDQDVVRINAFWLENFLGYAEWGIDTDDHPLNRLNMENETSRAILVEKYLLPAFSLLNQRQKFRAKETLRYAINYFTPHEWARWTSEVLGDISSSPTEMFIDVWGMMFPGETWLIELKEKYARVDDDREPLDRKRYGYIDLKGS